MRRTINDRLTVALPDTHFGEHEPIATELVVKAVEILKPGHICQGGDLLECGPFSAWPSHKVAAAKEYDFLKHEVEPARDWIRRLVKYTNFYTQMEGNHEFRVERMAVGYRPMEAVWGLIDPRRTILNEFATNQVAWIPYIGDHDVTNHAVLAGTKKRPTVIAVHGWSTADNAAKVHGQKAWRVGCSLVYNHTHTRQEVTTRDWRTGRMLFSMTPGCLRTLTPSFTQAKGPTDWSHGFTLIYTSKRDPLDHQAYNVAINVEKARLILPDGTEVSL